MKKLMSVIGAAALSMSPHPAPLSPRLDSTATAGCVQSSGISHLVSAFG